MKKATFCPLIQKACVEHKCVWYTMLRGINANTGDPVDDWGCAVAWLPVLLIENSNVNRQTGAAVESLRNESIKGEDATRSAIMTGLARAEQMRLADGNSTS